MLALAPFLRPRGGLVYPLVHHAGRPAHVYNAEILARSFDEDSPFRDFYEIHWRPLPNWTGHLLLAALVRILPARLADLIVMSLTLVGFSG